MMEQKRYRSRTYYPGERVCGSDMMPRVERIKGNKIPQKELFKKMNEAFEGKILVLEVSWGKNIKWSCTRGWPDGIIWWKYDNGKIFAMSPGGWNEIFI